MYQSAAKKVVFWNCMSECGLDGEKIPNFNGNFYYN